MNTKLVLCLFFFAALGMHAADLMALNYKLVDRWCIEHLDRMPPFLGKRDPIPVGCEIIDCCPGCPGGGTLEWRIEVGKTVFEGAELRFEGLSPGTLQKLSISGGGKLDGDRIVLRPGTTILKGLPRTASGKVPVASLTPILVKDASAKLVPLLSKRKPSPKDVDADKLVATITVRQLRGAFQVNDFRWRHVIGFCRVPPVKAMDRLDVRSIAGGDNTVVMMDSRTASGSAGCNNDQVLRSTGTTNLGNVLAAAGCNSEISIFSATNAMAWESPVTTWTDNMGDVHTSSLQGIINMPVSVWIADTNAAVAAQAVNDMANANQLYAQNKVGVQFQPTFTNVSSNAGAVTTIGTASCGAVAAIRASAFYSANALNIYYVNGAFTGENCARTTPVGDGNISYLGTLANLATLAHEIGHALGLRPAGSGGHTNTVAGFGTNNVMWGGGIAARDHFSLGQAFRMNTHTDVWGGTMLINNGLRPGPGRACAPLTTSDLCPALPADWVRP
jgi:hypothetical protein